MDFGMILFLTAGAYISTVEEPPKTNSQLCGFFQIGFIEAAVFCHFWLSLTLASDRHMSQTLGVELKLIVDPRSQCHVSETRRDPTLISAALILQRAGNLKS